MSRQEFCAHIEHDLFLLLNSKSAQVGQQLVEMMGYATLTGGKRLRPASIYLGAEAVGGDTKKLDSKLRTLALGLELIHCYSLVHDDLPAMDNDTLRRGKPTVHKAYGEANAILCGDALLNYAMETLLEGVVRYDDTNFNKAALKIAECAGYKGMIYGQYLDINGAGKDIRSLIGLNQYKSGKLFEAGFAAGGILAGATEGTVKILCNYGQNLGAAFQILDDIRDMKKDDISVAKLAGEAKARSYVVYYMGEAKKEAEKLQVRDGLNALADDMSRGEY